MATKTECFEELIGSKYEFFVGHLLYKYPTFSMLNVVCRWNGFPDGGGEFQ
jgi:hypothetical protein